MLDPIIEATRLRIDAIRQDVDELRRRALAMPPARGFGAALAAPGLSVIAEVKRRSPSRGALAPGLDPADLASRYAAGGASAISVLTEPDFFAGSSDDLVTVRRAVEIPVLRKDFTLEPVQVWEARAIGADAVLLILAVLDDATAAELLETAHEAGLDALVEVHTATEAERAVSLGAQIVGVNNRDLETFDVDLATAEALAPLLAGIPITVGESGVFDAADAARMRRAGYEAVLVGESLVRSDDPGGLLASIRGLE